MEKENNDVKIKVLDEDTINKIAAGEVVERPASVVKELVDNALDAGAQTIWIELEKSGKDKITVRDDGYGMSRSNAELAPLKHATSKIRTAKDLEHVKTMGFRGEALSSIGAVSKLEIITKRKEDDVGTHLIVESGQPDKVFDIGASDGTTIIVSDLFSSIPARKKYLKTDATELSHITKMATDLILANDGISFYLKNNGKKILSSPSSDLFNSIVDVLGNDVARSMIKIVRAEKTENTRETNAEKNGQIHIDGYISKPEFTRTSTDFLFFVVNGRPVSSKELINAVRMGYYTKIPKGLYPACVLRISLPEDLVDVNVHPRKSEIRFSNPEYVSKSVVSAIEETLRSVVLSSEVLSSEARKISSRSFSDYGTDIIEDDSTKNLKNSQKTEGGGTEYKTNMGGFKTYDSEVNRLNDNLKINESSGSKTYGQSTSDPAKTMQTPTLPEYAGRTDRFVYPLRDTERKLKFSERLLNENPLHTSSNISILENIRVVGLISDLYIIAESSDGGLLIIDQHAAHERIIYDLLCDNSSEKSVQELISPVVLNLSASEKVLMDEYIPYIEEAGFGVSEFGDTSFIVTFVPAVSGHFEDPEKIRDLIHDILETGNIQKKGNKKDLVMKTMACRAAIKAGARCTPEQMNRLISQLRKTANPYSCPHGRPTIVSFSKKELEKLFERS